MSKRISLAFLSGFLLLALCITCAINNPVEETDTKLMTVAEDVAVAENEILGIVPETISEETNEGILEETESSIEDSSVIVEDFVEDFIAEQYSLKRYSTMADDVKDIKVEIPEKKPTQKVTHGKLTFTYDPNLEYINKENLETRFKNFAPNDDFNKTVEAMSKMGFGEAGGCSHTEIAATFWNVLNRYDANYAKSIYGVVTASGQYHGYKTHHPVRDDIYELCIDVIARWVAEKEGVSEVGRILPSDYFWFYGDGKHNHYRNVYRGGARWTWDLPTPYAD